MNSRTMVNGEAEGLDGWPRLLTNTTREELHRWPVEEYSISELITLSACPDRYHYGEELGVPPGLDLSDGSWTAAELSADVQGAIAHELLGSFPGLEQGELAHRARELLKRALWSGGRWRFDRREVQSAAERIVAHIQRFRASDLARRITAAPEVNRELPFAYQMRPSIRLVGAIDVAFRETDGWRVVEYKTSDSPGAVAEDAAARHELQLTLYASALQAAVWPARVREAAVFFTDTGRSHNWMINLDRLALWEKLAERSVEQMRRRRFSRPAPSWCASKCEGCVYLQLCDPAGRP